MTNERHPDDRLTIKRSCDETGLSDKTIRRALTASVDPLPHLRVGVGDDPRHARVLIRRGDLEAWLHRRHAALSPKSIVDEIVESVRS